jgi:hypothetical protein
MEFVDKDKKIRRFRPSRKKSEQIVDIPWKTQQGIRIVPCEVLGPYDMAILMGTELFEHYKKQQEENKLP